ncbi:hypothetical protein O6H91_14G053500 [Diphasiastrum complanatum]|uniref:Uncharacterized protein n=1 Tax=Diphasiastrum complanatum TaxID=34168 RepID=A0ACC2BQ82_DIPCM|nr:hypothetical protein O6H91_14G053500 [Diphasiastrum complanatum]
MRWVQSLPGDFRGTPPSPRSGHTAVKVNKTLVAVFGGLVEKKFLQDLVVLDTENNVWFQPECTGGGDDALVGPCPRAFHVAVAIDCHMFIFGGRSGRKRLGDFWMLDTDTWQWAELSGYGELPPARDFAAGASVGNGKIVIYGGWDGSKWLSDIYVLDTVSLEWRQLPITGPLPAPRCGHTATMVEKRLLIFGGRGGGGPILGDLWALKGLFDEEREPPGWTQLKLPGSAPAPRCGHTTTSGGSQLLVFGGHGTAGWLTRHDIYHNDAVVLDRASVQWKRLPVSNEPPPPRAYHSLTRISPRFLMIGGYDGKSTFGDMWWLVSEDDPVARRALLAAQNNSSSIATGNASTKSATQTSTNDSKGGEQGPYSPLRELHQNLGFPFDAFAPGLDQSSSAEEHEEAELLELVQSFILKDNQFISNDPISLLKAVRDHWKECDARSLHLKELGPLFQDYGRLIETLDSLIETMTYDLDFSQNDVYRFYHLKSASQIRMDDVPALVAEYKHLLHQHFDNQSIEVQ